MAPVYSQSASPRIATVRRRAVEACSFHAFQMRMGFASPQLPFDTLGDLEPVFSGLLERKPTWEEKDKFQKSMELRSVPYIDIYAELRASMIWGGANRRPLGSDLEDVMAASLALPYCHVSPPNLPISAVPSGQCRRRDSLRD